MKNLLLFSLLFTFSITFLFAQKQERTEKLMKDSEKSKKSFIKTDPDMLKLFEESFGYVIFPNVGKGGYGVGGATGNGIVYEKGSAIGNARMTQLTIGLQAGGQAYQQVIFFENQSALDRFKNNKFEFAAQVSAVAAASGASADAKYHEGVLVFTLVKKGLMAEASIGGQKFNFSPFE